MNNNYNYRARFEQSLIELNKIGIIAPTKRKTDHVMKSIIL